MRGTRIVIPGTLREKILKLGHEGHPGIVWMKQRLISKLWWQGLDKDIEKHCKSFYGCQLVRAVTHYSVTFTTMAGFGY